MTIPHPMSILDLVKEFERGQMQLPEMQRGYVWKSTQVRDLLDSLYRGYPTGNILRWETTDNSVELRNSAIDQTSEKWANSYLLLDGQQRLTSLAAVVQGKLVQVRDSKKPIDIYFNLEHEENMYETELGDDEVDENIFEADDDDEKEENDPLDNYDKPFIVANNRVKQNPNWVSVTEVFKANDITPFLQRIGINSFDDPRYKKYQERLRRLMSIKDYEFPVITLKKELKHDEVADIFVRVNSLGTKLKGSDLALAQITSKWHGSLKIFDEFHEECKKTNWDISIGTLLRTLIAITTGQSKFKIVSSLSLEKLQEGWDKTKEAVSFVLAYLTQNFDIENQNLLSSPYFITTLAYFVYIRDKQITEYETSLLKKWFLIANAKGRYSWGSSETKLNEDLAAIKQGNMGKLLDIITTQFGRLDITLDDLRGKNRTSGFFKTMFTLMHRNRARDWNTDLVISMKHPGKKDKIEFHHIFPKNILKEKYDRREINDVSNLTFIGKVTNIQISDQNPEVYLSEIVKERGIEILKEHCIPMEEELWKIDRFIDFTDKRRELLLKLINDYLEEIKV